MWLKQHRHGAGTTARQGGAGLHVPPRLRPPLSAKHRHLKEELARLLEERGYRLTAAQELVVDLFLATERHQRLESLHEGLRRAFPEATVAEVKAAMRLLCELGVARSFIAGEDLIYEHEHLNEHHDHLVCIKCGAIEEFLDAEIEERQLAAARRARFRPLFHRLTIHGLCARCLEQAPAFQPLSHAAPGRKVRVEWIDGGHAMIHRLGSLGVTRGAILEVIHNQGAVDVVARGARVAIGAGMAERIFVSPDGEGGAVAAGPDEGSADANEGGNHGTDVGH